MTSKKAPSGKRAVLPRASDRTKAFVKDWTRLSHAGRFDMKRLKQVMGLLVSNDGPLGPPKAGNTSPSGQGGSQLTRTWGHTYVLGASTSRSSGPISTSVSSCRTIPDARSRTTRRRDSNLPEVGGWQSS